MPENNYESALTYQRVYSPALENNALKDSPRRDVMVLLPPSYFTTERRFPAVYLLHGYNGTNTSWTLGAYQGLNIQNAMEELVQSTLVQEMIFVMPDARNEYGGSYYTNSPLTGNWEDFIAQDLVNYIDSYYRTLPKPESRGLYGHSMGGYGAIYIGMKRSDVFGVVYGTSPACLDFVGDIADPEVWRETLGIKFRDDLGLLPQSGKHWRGNYANALTGFAAAVSPNLAKGPLFVDLPFEIDRGTIRPVESVRQRWLAHSPAAMVKTHLRSLQSLRGLRFTVGVQDHLTHIPLGSRSLSRALTDHGVSHVFDELEADHAGSLREWVQSRVLPYFSEMLTFDLSPGDGRVASVDGGGRGVDADDDVMRP